MSNDTQPPIEAEQPIEDKPKPPFYRRGGCWSWFQSITIFLFTIHLIYSSYELDSVRDENDLLNARLDIYYAAFGTQGLDDLTNEDPPYLTQTLTGALDELNGLAYSADGRFIVAGGDNVAVLWDTNTNRVVQTFEGHSFIVKAVAISADGKQVLTGSYDKTAILWDTSTGQAIFTLAAGQGIAPITGVAFSPDGQYLLTGTSGGFATLWNSKTGEAIREYQGEHGYLTSIAFSPDGEYIAAGTGRGIAELWDAKTGKLLRIFEGHIGNVNSVVFSPDGNYLLTGSWDGTAILWDATTATNLQTFDDHLDDVICVAFSPDGHYFVTGSADRMAKLWEIETGKVIRTFSILIPSRNSDIQREITLTFLGQIQGIAFSPDGRYVVTGYGSGAIRIWESGIGSDTTPVGR